MGIMILFGRGAMARLSSPVVRLSQSTQDGGLELAHNGSLGRIPIIALCPRIPVEPTTHFREELQDT